MIPLQISKVLASLLDVLSDSEATWALTGSTRLALAGIALAPQDIDLQTDAAGAYEIEESFSAWSLKTVRYTDSGHVRSHLGAFKFGGVKVEVIGDIEHRLADGSWTAPPDLPDLIETIDWEGRQVPVLPLAYEADAYAMLGRAERAALLRRFLAEGSSSRR